MKMKKSLVALCLSAGLFASVPGISLADVNIVPQDTAAAPSIPTAALQQLAWTPVDQSKTQSTPLATAGQRLDIAGISGPVAAYSVPANIGELTLTLSSEVNQQTSVFAPNVLILDQNMTPSAFFPSSYFTYQAPGVMSADRLEGIFYSLCLNNFQFFFCFSCYLTFYFILQNNTADCCCSNINSNYFHKTIPSFIIHKNPINLDNIKKSKTYRLWFHAD